MFDLFKIRQRQANADSILQRSGKSRVFSVMYNYARPVNDPGWDVGYWHRGWIPCSFHRKVETAIDEAVRLNGLVADVEAVLKARLELEGRGSSDRAGGGE